MRNVLIFLMVSMVPLAADARASRPGCESGHWVQSVSLDGSIVTLEDGSVWRINPIDAIDTILWLPTTDIVACGDALINTDDKEKVEAFRVR